MAGQKRYRIGMSKLSSRDNFLFVTDPDGDDFVCTDVS